MLKVFILVIAILLALATYISHPILAGGDQVQGGKAVGTANQYCDTPDYNGDCPFGDYQP